MYYVFVLYDTIIQKYRSIQGKKNCIAYPFQYLVHWNHANRYTGSIEITPSKMINLIFFKVKRILDHILKFRFEAHSTQQPDISEKILSADVSASKQCKTKL